MVWRFSRDLYDRRGRGQDPLLGLNSEDADQGAAPRVLAHPGAQSARTKARHHASVANSQRLSEGRTISAVWEPHGLGLGPSRPEATLQAASRIAEAPYPDGPLASRKAP